MSSLEVIAKGISSVASAAFSKALASADWASYSQTAFRKSLVHFLSQEVKTVSWLFVEQKHSARSFFLVHQSHTLKNPMTATSWSAIRDSAAVTSVRVVTAGPVRFFSQLTMSSACLPAAKKIQIVSECIKWFRRGCSESELVALKWSV